MRSQRHNLTKHDANRLKFLQKRASNVAAFLKNGGNRIRLQMVRSLLDSEMSTAALHGGFAHAEQGIKHHLKLLELGEIVTGRRQGHEKFYRLTEKGEALARCALSIGG
jgi:hypothetical protein